MSIRKPTPKAAVKLIRDAFTQAGADCSTKVAYNLLAQVEGFKNWDHAKSVLTAGVSVPKVAPQVGKLSSEIQGWPVFVLYMAYSEDDFDEQIWAMPYGSTLEGTRAPRGSFYPFIETGSKQIPEDLFGTVSNADMDAVRMRSFVLTKVFSTVPEMDKYGIPWFANEALITKWATQEMGWNYLASDHCANRSESKVEVSFCDTGDASGALWWAEVAVEPALAKRLMKLLAAIPDSEAAD
jgi:hypothetical protein